MTLFRQSVIKWALGQLNKRKMGVTKLLLKDERTMSTMSSERECEIIHGTSTVESLEPFNKENRRYTCLAFSSSDCEIWNE